MKKEEIKLEKERKIDKLAQILEKEKKAGKKSNNKQLAKQIGTSERTIKRYLEELEEGKIITRDESIKPQDNRALTMEENIKKLARILKKEEAEGKKSTNRQLAEQLEVSEPTLRRYKAELKKQEKLEEEIKDVEEAINELMENEEINSIVRRREIIKVMCNSDEYETGKQIYEKLKELGFADITQELVNVDISYLKRHGEIAKTPNEKKAEKIQKRREIVKREYNSTEGNKRKTREEIQEIAQQEMNMKVSINVIDEDISYWIKKGELNEKMKTKQQRRRAIVKNGVINQQTAKQIQEEIKKKMKIEVSLEKIGDDISYLEIEGEIEPKDENLVIRKRREVELYKQDATVEEIQETIKKEFNVKVSLAVIYRDIRPYIKLEKEEKLAIKMPHKELRRVVKMSCKEFYGQANLIMILKRYMSSCKIRFENNVLKAEDLPVIKEVAILTQNYEDMAFYLKVAISEEKFEEAQQYRIT